MTNKSESEKFFEEYRNLKSSVKNIQNKIVEMRKITEELTQKRETLQSEISAMRRIITAMVDNGWDPVEAKLKLSENTFSISMWDDVLYDTTTGATGATGPSDPYLHTITLGTQYTKYTKI